MKLGIYVHIPYCVKKCNYCDFDSESFTGKEKKSLEYFSQLKEDIKRAGRLYSPFFTVDSIFFGGGTPSLIEAEIICSILEEIKQNFTIEEDAEISLEANPGTLNEEKLLNYKLFGFNRLSLGVQSLDTKVLKTMGRIHDGKEALNSFALAKKYFDNINIDLMLGVPFQNLKIFEDTLFKILLERPSHLSFYSLQLEEGTPFYSAYKNGKLNLPSWEENRLMYHNAIEILKKEGYEHYEISNAALPNQKCRHNIKYWTMKPYIGFGRAAHSFLAGKRFENGAFPLLLENELSSAAKNSSYFGNFDEERKKDLKGDFVFTNLRLIEGLSYELYKKFFSENFKENFPETLTLISENLLEEENQKLKFTKKGLDHTNLVMEKLLECLEK